MFKLVLKYFARISTKKFCAWPMEFFQLGTVIYNEGKGNEQYFKEERRKNPSNNINKLGVSETKYT